MIKTGNTSKIPNFAFPGVVIMQLGWLIYWYLQNNTDVVKVIIMTGSAFLIYASLGMILKKQLVNLGMFYSLLGVLAMILRVTPILWLGRICSVTQMLSSSMNLELIVIFLYY